MGHSELPGARVDIKNWVNFLKSDMGGAWENSEIVSLSKPSSSQVKSELNVVSDCYCFVAFSGHGSNGSILLNDNWTNGYPIESLKPSSRQGTLIVDACRGVEEAVNFSFGEIAVANESRVRSVELSAARHGYVMASDYYRSMQKLGELKSRHYSNWESALNGSLRGIVTMLACSKGQAAGEDPDAGGLYTSQLLNSVVEWQKKVAEGIHTTKDAHDYAARNLPRQQTPEYSPLSLTFPFAVKV